MSTSKKKRGKTAGKKKAPTRKKSKDKPKRQAAKAAPSKDKPKKTKPKKEERKAPTTRKKERKEEKKKAAPKKTTIKLERVELGPPPKATVEVRHIDSLQERAARGFSFGELSSAGVPLNAAKREGLSFDIRRRSVVDGNVEVLKSWFKSPKQVSDRGAEEEKEPVEVAAASSDK